MKVARPYLNDPRSHRRRPPRRRRRRNGQHPRCRQEELDATVDQLAAEVAEVPTQAQRLNKELLNKSLEIRASAPGSGTRAAINATAAGGLVPRPRVLAICCTRVPASSGAWPRPPPVRRDVTDRPRPVIDTKTPRVDRRGTAP